MRVVLGQKQRDLLWSYVSSQIEEGLTQPLAAGLRETEEAIEARRESEAVRGVYRRVEDPPHVEIQRWIKIEKWVESSRRLFRPSFESMLDTPPVSSMKYRMLWAAGGMVAAGLAGLLFFPLMADIIAMDYMLGACAAGGMLGLVTGWKTLGKFQDRRRLPAEYARTLYQQLLEEHLAATLDDYQNVVGFFSTSIHDLTGPEESGRPEAFVEAFLRYDPASLGAYHQYLSDDDCFDQRRKAVEGVVHPAFVKFINRSDAHTHEAVRVVEQISRPH